MPATGCSARPEHPLSLDTGNCSVTDADLAYLRRFERLEITEAEWTHEAHVHLAWILLTLCDADDAEQRLRRGIQRYNCRVLRRPERYHETVTLAFARIIASRLRPGEAYDAFLDRCPEVLSADDPVLLSYYSPERLFSEWARREFVAPDRSLLPQRPGQGEERCRN